MNRWTAPDLYAQIDAIHMQMRQMGIVRSKRAVMEESYLDRPPLPRQLPSLYDDGYGNLCRVEAGGTDVHIG